MNLTMNFVAKLIYKKFKSFRFRWTRKLRPILWPNGIHTYPFKCRRMPELTDQFLAERQAREQTNPRKKLSVDDYKQLIVDERSEDIVKAMVNLYNTKMFRTQFYPTTVTLQDMEYILENNINGFRLLRQLDFFFIREFDIWRKGISSAEARAKRHEEEQRKMAEVKTIGCFDDQNRLQYGFWRNTMFTRYFDKSPRNYSFHKLRTATLFGQPMVIDCSFDKEMQEYEIQSVGRQMARIYQMNRLQSRQPFDLHFCNCNPESRTMKNFLKYMYPIDDSKENQKYCLNIHTESYLQLFPNQRLIYLSPDAKDTMEEFDHNAIYIMGSLVGKTCRLPFSKWKARDEGLECLRLPIHKYVKLNPLVRKTLSFQGVYKILLELQDHNDWELAFKRGIMEHKLKKND